MSAKSLIRSELSEMLEPMLATGLSRALTTALREIQIQIPALKKEISDGLLKILSQILMNQPWRHPGMPKSLLMGSGGGSIPGGSGAVTPSGGMTGTGVGGSGSSEHSDTANVVLALETLAKFDVDSKFFFKCINKVL